LLKSIIVDEEHHIKILEHIEELVSSSGKWHFWNQIINSDSFNNQCPSPI
jgi:bacterioferritin (cytochrome b1)